MYLVVTRTPSGKSDQSRYTSRRQVDAHQQFVETMLAKGADLDPLLTAMKELKRKGSKLTLLDTIKLGLLSQQSNALLKEMDLIPATV